MNLDHDDGGGDHDQIYWNDELPRAFLIHPNACYHQNHGCLCQQNHN